MDKPKAPPVRWVREETPVKLILSYIQYVIENVRFNSHHKSLYGADLKVFRNCSWKEFKKRRDVKWDY